MNTKKTLRRFLNWRLSLVFGILSLSLVLCLCTNGKDSANYSALVEIHKDFREFRRPKAVEGMIDYSKAAMEARREILEDMKGRLEAIDPGKWDVSQKVDYLLVRAELNGLDFEMRIMCPWEKDPGLYVRSVSRLPFTNLPFKEESNTQFKMRLKAVPMILSQAKKNLARPAAEFARLAIHSLERSDGINQGEPKREMPPEGVIGWYKDLLQRLPAHHPDLVEDGQQALAAVEDFRDWLKENENSMSEPAYIGLDNFEWYVKNVRLMPYSVKDISVIAETEWDRTLTFLKIEEQKNRALPQIEPAVSEEDHARRVQEAEVLIRAFIAENELLSFDKNIPPQFETEAYWINRPGGKRHFWEELTYRDPLNNHVHASIPGHHYDMIVHRRSKHPIRGTYMDGGRAEGWAFYLEEMLLQAGMLDDRPRTRELFYIAQLARVLRIPIELQMHSGKSTLDEAIEFIIKEVPYMDEDLARYDLQTYLRRPAYGMTYLIGKLQFEHLLRDRARQLGDQFDLGKFHDEFMSFDIIPISLIRWEMTGLEDEIKKLWK